MQNQAVKYALEVDAKHKVIKVGKWQASRIYYNSPIRENDFTLKQEVLEENEADVDGLLAKIQGGGHRDVHKFIAPLLGNKFYAQLRAVSRKIWITPIEATLNKYCLHWGNTGPYFDEGQIRRAWQCLHLIEQAEQDGIHHVIPFLIYFMESPAGLKSKLGKGTWKKLAHSSLSANLCLVQRLIGIEWSYKHSNPNARAKKLMSRRSAEISEDVRFLVGVKKTVLRQYPTWPLQVGETYTANSAAIIRHEESRALLAWLNKYAKVTIREDVQQLAIMYRDTLHLSQAMGREFKARSPRKMRDYHNKLARESRELREAEKYKVVELVNKNMAWLKRYADEAAREFSNHKIKVEIICDYERLLDEGEAMRHCVADYQRRITSGKYIVASLKSDVQRSTLGIRLGVKAGSKAFVVDQHFGYDNTPLFCDASRAFAGEICDLCNHVYQK